MAKIGYLVLNDGIWNNNRIISSEWIQKMVKEQVSFSDTQGYGYHWWLRTYQLGSYSIDSYYASGWGGQSIIVLPALNAVVVFTSGNYDRKDPSNEIIHRYLLPALVPDYEKNVSENDSITFEQIQKEAPLAEAIDIIDPAENLIPNIKALSGHWYGRWDYAAASQLTVERIDNDKAVIIYTYLDRGALRKEVNILPSGKIEFGIGSATLTFEMDKREDVLIGQHKDGPSTSRIIMERK